MFLRPVRYIAAGFCLLFFSPPAFPVPTPAKVTRESSLEAEYASALAVADHFLQAWQTGDAENGIAMLTEHAKKGMNPDDLDKLFPPPIHRRTRSIAASQRTVADTNFL